MDEVFAAGDTSEIQRIVSPQTDTEDAGSPSSGLALNAAATDATLLSDAKAPQPLAGDDWRAPCDEIAEDGAEISDTSAIMEPSFRQVDSETIIPTNAQDQALLAIAPGAFVSDAILPSGLKVPSAPFFFEWRVKGDSIHLDFTPLQQLKDCVSAIRRFLFGGS